jgi:hypothetical protein
MKSRTNGAPTGAAVLASDSRVDEQLGKSRRGAGATPRTSWGRARRTREARVGRRGTGAAPEMTGWRRGGARSGRRGAPPPNPSFAFWSLDAEGLVRTGTGEGRRRKERNVFFHKRWQCG